MIVIGVDFHPEFQQIASVDTETGEFQEKRWGIARKRRRSIAGSRPQGRGSLSASIPHAQLTLVCGSKHLVKLLTAAQLCEQ
jgi:hypothetical protein